MIVFLYLYIMQTKKPPLMLHYSQFTAYCAPINPLNTFRLLLCYFTIVLHCEKSKRFCSFFTENFISASVD
ncbi:hypothetical protein CW304_25135 [Bacillus sp. UFRGS-B20]|nr:hypothetical protein CW304_25135 [Bacillus sp. UFRGS-B20]